MTCCELAFRPLLAGLDDSMLTQHAGPIFGLWADLRLAYMNPAWLRFAAENGGEPQISRDWGPGASFIDAIPPPMVSFYRQAFARCLATREPWRHEYECSSPTRYRRFLQIAYPLRGAGLLVVNTMTIDRPQTERPDAAKLADYLDANDKLQRCVYCGRVLANHLGVWHWAPDWAASKECVVAAVSCPVCRPESDHHRLAMHMLSGVGEGMRRG